MVSVLIFCILAGIGGKYADLLELKDPQLHPAAFTVKSGDIPRKKRSIRIEIQDVTSSDNTTNDANVSSSLLKVNLDLRRIIKKEEIEERKAEGGVTLEVEAKVEVISEVEEKVEVTSDIEVKVEVTSEVESSGEAAQLHQTAAYSDQFIHCWACDAFFRFETHFVKHAKKEHGETHPYKCASCHISYTSKRNLLRHFVISDCKDANGEIGKCSFKVMTCELCSFTFRSIKAYERHALEAHRGVKMMRCSECDAAFFQNSSLTKHVNKKHPGLLFCTICKRNFLNSDVLRAHQNDCEKEMKRILEERARKEKVKEQRKRYHRLKYCFTCQIPFPSRRQYQDHRKAHHPKSNKMRLKVYECHSCQTTFAFDNDLKSHTMECHPKADTCVSRVFTCAYCGLKLGSWRKYEHHGATKHWRLPMFHCGHCDKSFAKKNGVDRHVKDKHGDYKERCQFCPRYYFRSDQLKSHEKTCKSKLYKTLRVRKRTDSYAVFDDA